MSAPIINQPWEDVASDVTGAIEQAVQPLLKKAVDEIYTGLLEATQDYLRDNLAFNIASRIDTAEREAARDRARADDLYAALSDLADVFAYEGEGATARFDRLAAMFRKDTGYTAPGRDQPASGVVAKADRDEIAAIYDAWYASKVTRARAALAKVTAS